jgi:hypothetical protein
MLALQNVELRGGDVRIRVEWVELGAKPPLTHKPHQTQKHRDAEGSDGRNRIGWISTEDDVALAGVDPNATRTEATTVTASAAVPDLIGPMRSETRPR